MDAASDAIDDHSMVKAVVLIYCSGRFRPEPDTPLLFSLPGIISLEMVGTYDYDSNKHCVSVKSEGRFQAYRSMGFMRRRLDDT